MVIANVRSFLQVGAKLRNMFLNLAPHGTRVRVVQRARNKRRSRKA